MNNSIIEFLNSDDIIESGLCIGCGACCGICPYRKISKGKAVVLFECTNNSDISQCDLFCPQTHNDYQNLWENFFGLNYEKSSIGHFKAIYKAKAGNKFHELFKQRKTTTALNAFILDEKISQSVLTHKCDENLNTYPFLATQHKEIIQSVQISYITDSPIEFININKPKNYSFTGLPCQCLALAKMKSLKQIETNFTLPEITISLFCSWAFEPKDYKKYIEANFPQKHLKTSKIHAKNNKDIIFTDINDNHISKDLSEIKSIIKKGCSICNDLTGEFSDISVGDYEKDENFNILISRTDKGEKLIKQAQKKGYIQLTELPVKDIKELEKASLEKKKKAFANLEQLFPAAQP